MGKKLKPKYSFEEQQDSQEQEKFEVEIESADYESAIRVCRTPSDKRGHSERINLRVLPFYTRVGSELIHKEPRFRTISDFWRTCLNLGCRAVLQELKAKGKVGSEFDDLLLITDEMEKERNADYAYRHFERTIKKIPISLQLYAGDQKAFKKRVLQLKEKIEGLGDPFWRDRLMKKLGQALSCLDGDFDQFQKGDGWEEDL